MDLDINLLEKKGISKFRIVFGIVFILLMVIRSYVVLRDGEGFSSFDWIYTLLFVLTGIGHIIMGLGFTFSGLLGGKAYISIDNIRIAFKPASFKNERMILWDDIRRIEYKPALYRITKTDSTETLDLKSVDYTFIQMIKAAVTTIAKEKSIEIR